MARMHSRKKGKSGSKRPSKGTLPAWLRYTESEVEQLIIKLAKQEKTSSEIGMILRDSYGIPESKAVTKKTVTQILKENKIGLSIPEDLRALVKKDIKLAKHMEAFRKDMTVKRGQQLTESKINRLSKYYKRKGILPKNCQYDRSKAKLLIE